MVVCHTSSLFFSLDLLCWLIGIRIIAAGNFHDSDSNNNRVIVFHETERKNLTR